MSQAQRTANLRLAPLNFDAANVTSTSGGNGGDDMEQRLTALEKAFIRVDANLEYLKANSATKADVAEAKNDVTRWVLASFLTAIAVGVTVMTFVLNNATPKASAPAPSQPQPIVIQLPAQAVQPPPPPPAAHK